jgi:uncharacterized protein YoxC
MVTKKKLLKRIDYLESEIEVLASTVKGLLSVTEDTQEELAKCNSKNTESIESINSDIYKIKDKIDYLYRLSDANSQKATQTLFDEWMNGAKKEGEN